MKNKYLQITLRIVLIILISISPFLLYQLRLSLFGGSGWEDLGEIIFSVFAIPFIIVLGFVVSQFTRKLGDAYIWSVAGYVIIAILVFIVMLTHQSRFFFMLLGYEYY